jgi:hypothetical protein
LSGQIFSRSVAADHQKIAKKLKTISRSNSPASYDAKCDTMLQYSLKMGRAERELE